MFYAWVDQVAVPEIDRLTFNALIIETGTDSYRLRTTQTNKKNHTG